MRPVLFYLVSGQYTFSVPDVHLLVLIAPIWHRRRSSTSVWDTVLSKGLNCLRRHKQKTVKKESGGLGSFVSCVTLSWSPVLYKCQFWLLKKCGWKGSVHPWPDPLRKFMRSEILTGDGERRKVKSSLLQPEQFHYKKLIKKKIFLNSWSMHMIQNSRSTKRLPGSLLTKLSPAPHPRGNQSHRLLSIFLENHPLPIS